ncbi:MAG: hypothetical protein ABIP68_02135, partial [Ferruginibacter sp.]
YASPTLSNLIISNNSAPSGGGIYNNNSSPLISHLNIINNSSYNGGGGIYNNYSTPNISNCNITSNVSSGGGGITNDFSNSILTNVIINGNKADIYGGGVFNYSCSPLFTNVVISGNYAVVGGAGGMYNSYSSPKITNSTIAGNEGGFYGGGIFNNNSSSPLINNTVIYGNNNGIKNYDPATSVPVITNSLVQGLSNVSNGNIDGNINPKFITAPSYTTAPFTGGDYRLQFGSVLINSGNNEAFSGVNINTKDLGDKPRVSNYSSGGIIDIGAYEYEGTVLPIVYVKIGGTGNGSSWANAIGDLRAAINSDGVQQVWVAKGTYQPLASTSFVMKNGLAIYGGFNDTGNPTMIDRDWKNNATILKGNNNRVINNNFTSLNPLLSNAILDGFTVTMGNTNSNGGGIYNNNASPRFNNLIISNNSAYSGGGLFNESSSPNITNVIIKGNTVGAYGGGMYNTSS